jgi:hypothetical protein
MNTEVPTAGLIILAVISGSLCFALNDLLGRLLTPRRRSHDRPRERPPVLFLNHEDRPENRVPNVIIDFGPHVERAEVERMRAEIICAKAARAAARPGADIADALLELSRHHRAARSIDEARRLTGLNVIGGWAFPSTLSTTARERFTNCRNCGAPPAGAPSCDYCGTYRG